LQPTGGIFELINHLAIKKCVASSSSLGRLEHSLGLAGLWTYFAPHVFSAMQVKHPKPAPDLFLFAAQQMGVVPAECLVIEDSIAGVKAAKAAGMRVFGYIGGSHCNNEHGTTLMREGAEQVFAHMDQLAEVLPRSTQQGAVRGS
jgi:beta-phosphoglucomutase-like phosphatase (HAD superfamily)